MSYHLGVDASNIKNGGGITHLSCILNAFKPSPLGISKITVWGPIHLNYCIEQKPWINIVTPFWLNGGLYKQLFGQHFYLNQELKKFKCDLLFCPGGMKPLFCSIKTVTMCQNMLPFSLNEARRFGLFSLMFFKMLSLRLIQSISFKKSSGVIFLTNYAKEIVSNQIGLNNSWVTTIPHGIEERFKLAPRFQKDITEYSFINPFKMLYVSLLMPYKMQLEVARAVHELRCSGVPLEISFIGSSWSQYGKRVRNELQILDRDGIYLKWFDNIEFYKLHEYYHAADGFIFASSCENLPNILIEAMASGLPILCSDRSAMREVLGDKGLYFNPDDHYSITKALVIFLKDRVYRSFLATDAYCKHTKYSWKRSSFETFCFFENLIKNSK